MMIGGEGQAPPNPLTQRSTDGPFGGHLAIASHRHGHETFKFTTGLGGNDLDQPACGIATKERTLRAAQYFDPLQVKCLATDCTKGGHVNFVGIEGNRGFLAIGKVILADAAQVEDRDRGAVLVDLQRGHLTG